MSEHLVTNLLKVALKTLPRILRPPAPVEMKKAGRFAFAPMPPLRYTIACVRNQPPLLLECAPAIRVFVNWKVTHLMTETMSGASVSATAGASIRRLSLSEAP